jgi:hypothetical protein
VVSRILLQSLAAWRRQTPLSVNVSVSPGTPRSCPLDELLKKSYLLLTRSAVAGHHASGYTFVWGIVEIESEVYTRTVFLSGAVFSDAIGAFSGYQLNDIWDHEGK